MKVFNHSTLAYCIFSCVAASVPAHAAVVFHGNAVGSFSNPLSDADDYVLIDNRDAGTKKSDAATFKWGTISAKLACVGDGDCQVVPKPKSGSSLFAFDGVGAMKRKKATRPLWARSLRLAHSNT